MSNPIVERWTYMRSQISRDAIESKDSQRAVADLVGAYAQLTAEERPHVDRLLAAWLESEDEGIRFDALAVIAAKRIRTALPELMALERRLAESTTPSAVFERARVARVLSELEAG